MFIIAYASSAKYSLKSNAKVAKRVQETPNTIPPARKISLKTNSVVARKLK